MIARFAHIAPRVHWTNRMSKRIFLPGEKEDVVDEDEDEQGDQNVLRSPFQCSKRRG